MERDRGGVDVRDRKAILIYNQAAYDIRCEWGENGVKQLAPISDALIIVDVMSFSTCVSVAVSNQAQVYPHKFRDNSAIQRATELGAVLAKARAGGLYSLSPETMLKLEAGMKLLLPSKNGATLSLLAGEAATFVGSLRNAKAVASAAMRVGSRIGVVPAGERWNEDDSLRPALEDLIGAGAIISCLSGTKSPEAQMAESTFKLFQSDLIQALAECSSGRELIAAGFEKDIEMIAALNADSVAPRLMNGFYSAIEDNSHYSNTTVF